MHYWGYPAPPESGPQASIVPVGVLEPEGAHLHFKM